MKLEGGRDAIALYVRGEEERLDFDFDFWCVCVRASQSVCEGKGEE